MGRTYKDTHDRYTLEFKLQAVRLADKLNVTAIEVAEVLGIHVVMLYRWRMEKKNGVLRENKHMKAKSPSPKRLNKSKETPKNDSELVKAQKRIRELEKVLEQRDEELDLLKKAKRFFAERNQ